MPTVFPIVYATMNRMPTIVIDGVIFHMQVNGGVSRTFYELLPRLCELDASLRILLLAQQDAKQNVPVHQSIENASDIDAGRYFGSLPSDKIRRVLKELFQTKTRYRVLLRNRDNIWHTTYFTSPPVFWKGPFVVSVYDMIHELYPQFFSSPMDKLLRWKKRKSLRKADHVICNSQTTANDVCEIYGVCKSKISVIPLASSDVFETIAPSIAPSYPPYFLFIGRRRDYKNFALLAQAFSSLRKKRDCQLVIVGRPLSSLEKNNSKSL